MNGRPDPARVAIGLGSNLGDRRSNLQIGFEGLARLLDAVRNSPVYETAPRHVSEQPPFLNACCVGSTRLSPRQLLSALQDLEQAAGRRRGRKRYGPRVLDLDLLLYGNERVEEPGLVVPHPLMHERAFVLIPLRDIAGDWRVPASDERPACTVRQLAADVSTEGVEPTNLNSEDA